LKQRPIRAAAAAGSLIVVITYLVAQMVGAGTLIRLMFGLPFEIAIIITGGLMICYVLFWGIVATTWVQIIKACLLLGGATLLVVLTMLQFGFSYGELFKKVEYLYSQKFLEPGGLVTNPLDAFSLGLALMFGTAGLPHILMRFFTVPDVKAARKSVFYATGFIGYFYILTVTIGFGSAVLVGQDIIKGIDAGGNMAAPLLAEVIGGNIFLGFLSAVAFATIFAVVAGLTLAWASAFSHDLYVGVVRKGEASEIDEVRVAKVATIGLGITAILLGILFKEQNVAFLVGLAFAIAASANFPALIMSLMWKKFTTAGAVSSIITGLTVAIVLLILSPTVWVDIVHKEQKLAVEKKIKGIEEGLKAKIYELEKQKTPDLKQEQITAITMVIDSEKRNSEKLKKEAKAEMPQPIFPLRNPGIFSMAAAFFIGIFVSLISPDKEAEKKYSTEKLREYTGIGAED